MMGAVLQEAQERRVANVKHALASFILRIIVKISGLY
jgi:hypothetical protein